MTPLPTAALGPPSRIDLAPAGPLLDVRIWDPRSSTNGSMKELYTRMYYRVVYWEHSDSRVHHHTPMVPLSMVPVYISPIPYTYRRMYTVYTFTQTGGQIHH